MKTDSCRILHILVCIVCILLCVAAVAVCVLADSGLVGALHPLRNARESQVRVACVGDSLTYGFGIPDHNDMCYPARLQQALGDGYCVNNYGYSGRTASSQGDRPYTTERLYEQSKEFAPEIVIIMLGSNDTKPYNWQNDEHYLAEYRKIIDEYLALDSVRTLVLMAPTPVFAKNGKVPYHIDQALIDRLPALAAQLYAELAPTLQDKDIEGHFVDLYPLFAGRPELFSDGAHPTRVGAKMIADALYLELTAK